MPLDYGTLKFKEIETIVTVSKCKSFYEAACVLNYTPSVISKSVISVERVLGFSLFVRGNRASTVSLTKEGEKIMPSFIRIYETIRRLQEEVIAMQSENTDFLKIGVTLQLSNHAREEIMSSFIVQHPEIRIEQYRHDFVTLVQMLYSGSVSGVFLIALDESPNMEKLREVINDPQIESYCLDRESDMYLGISETADIAELDEAPISAFKDYTIVFPQDDKIIFDAGVMGPFERMFDNMGAKLKKVFLDPMDSSAHCIATKKRIAIPTRRPAFIYPGIKYIRISDYANSSLTAFVCRKNDNGRALTLLKKCIQNYQCRNGLTEKCL